MREATIMVADGHKGNVDELASMLEEHEYPLMKLIMQPGPELIQDLTQYIVSAKPDLVIINIHPFSYAGDMRDVGIKIAQSVRKSSNNSIPFVFYSTVQNYESLSWKEWFGFMACNPLGFLRKLSKRKEVLDTVYLGLRAIQAEKQLRLANENLQRQISMQKEELSPICRELERESLERRRSEVDAAESKQVLRTVFNSVKDSIFIKDQRLIYRMVNPAMARTLDMTESEILGKTDRDIFGEEDFEHFQELERRVLNGESIEQEYSSDINGVTLTFLDSRVPLKNVFGEIVGICGISRDVTETTEVVPEKSAVDSEYTSSVMQACLKQASMAEESQSVILLLGESGSGKDHLSRYIHDHSKRANGPFFSINCAAIPPERAESELFGHEKGAFTGAHDRKRGLLELAEGGTLLLNEIGELSLTLQAKLLTFVDTRKFTRVGAENEIEVNARLIAATNRDLKKEVDTGHFRRDLFYRINALTITVPPLRNRRQDIPGLVQKIVLKICQEQQYSNLPLVTHSAMRTLREYNWPGNVRELENVLERALLMTHGQKIDVGSLGIQVEHHTVEKRNSDFGVMNAQSVCAPENFHLIARPHGDFNRRPIDPGPEVLRFLWEKYKEGLKWPMDKLAKAMKIDRTTLSTWFKKYHISKPSPEQ